MTTEYGVLMTRDEAQQYVDYWKRVGPLLEAIEKEELRNYSHADRMHDITALLDLGAQFARPRSTSGLLEQQRLFHGIR